MKNYLLLLFVLIAPFGLKAQTKVTLSKDTTTYDASNIERQPAFLVVKTSSLSLFL
ncbi:hypothetical protein [Mucilaginibacter antarcticus]|uniref:hypothetical protein n=1 Tax=Mucilaginibacter antarcticus TaxID=1855725 RepID=UPI003644C834